MKNNETYFICPRSMTLHMLLMIQNSLFQLHFYHVKELVPLKLVYNISCLVKNLRRNELFYTTLSILFLNDEIDINLFQ